MTRVTSGAGIVYPSMTPESIPVLVGSSCPICSVLCVILQPVLSCYSFYFFFNFLSFFDLQFLITLSLYSNLSYWLKQLKMIKKWNELSTETVLEHIIYKGQRCIIAMTFHMTVM